jgi:MoaA/NifB/PqqE/SkfB family radical SAM enzyme
LALSVGIGLTNDCNLTCAHCYRPTDRIYCLSLDDVQAICLALPVGSMGMGTGENALHPQFLEIVQYLSGRGVRLTIASNGYSLNTIADECLRAFQDVEVSIDFGSEREQDLFRGAGNWRAVHAAIGRCQGLGIEVSILATMMNANYAQMPDLVRLARSRGTNLRINAYQPVRNERYRLSYAQFWEGYQGLLSVGQLVSCTEPVVRAALGIGPAHSPCGQQSVRITPQGFVVPCVYWPDHAHSIADLRRLGEGIVETPEFRRASAVPPAARDCPCQGGCASRRALAGQLDAHDEYCPWVRGQQLHIDWQPSPAKELLRAGNVCTTIVR